MTASREHVEDDSDRTALCQHHALVLRSVRNLTHADDDIRAQIAGRSGARRGPSAAHPTRA